MNDHQADEHLMRRVAAGERGAQEVVLRRVLRRLQVVAAAILEHSEDAEDATQAALIQILRRAETYRGGSTIETWAMKIAAREALRIARERRLRAARTVSEAHASESTPALPRRLASEIPRDIREYLRELPETLRNALVLRHVCDYTIAEIAELLEVPSSTVKDRLVRARSALRRMIRREVDVPQRGRASQ